MVGDYVKIVFIDIGYDCEELNEPLGIEVLESYIKIKAPDIQTGMMFTNIDGNDYFTFLSDEKPDIIAVSTHINTWERWDNFYREYLSYSNSINGHLVLMVGGIIATYEYDELLSAYPDVICSIGEGEESILSVCRLFDESDNHIQFLNMIEKYNSPNLAFRHENRTVVTDRSVINDLEKENIPINHKYLRKIVDCGGLARMEASRGCPWNECTFCVLKWKYNKIKWRPYSLEKVFTEIVELSNIGAEVIYFTDEEFVAGDYDRLDKFINQIWTYKQNGIINPNLEFVASTSVHSILYNKNGGDSNPTEYLRRLKQIGFRSLFVGIESGSETQLRRFCKGTTVNEIERVLYFFHESNIEPDVGYIIFDPLMNLDELIENLQFLERNNLHHQISRFAKRLRIVPFIKYCQLPELQLDGFDRKQIEYYYTFSNEKIAYIYKIYSEWELYNISHTHKLQAEIRALSTSSDNRMVLKQKLACIRKKEYDVLLYLVNKVKNNTSLLFECVDYSEEARRIEELIEKGNL